MPNKSPQNSFQINQITLFVESGVPQKMQALLRRL